MNSATEYLLIPPPITSFILSKKEFQYIELSSLLYFIIHYFSNNTQKDNPLNTQKCRQEMAEPIYDINECSLKTR